MAFSKSTTTYSDRTVDLLLLQTVYTPVTDKEVTPAVVTTPHIVTGIEKLVQRVALLFLTQQGSIKNSESEGSTFITNLAHGKITDDYTLQIEATAAVTSVASQIKQEDVQLKTPDDEALQDLTAVDLQLNRSTATVTVSLEIVSVAGEHYTYTVPLKTGV